MKYIDKCSMPYTLHDSLASEVLSWPMVRPYRYNLASYVARGGVRCGFIPLEVWRQRTYALHSYAFIEVIFADGVVLYSKREVLYNLLWSFEEMRWHWLFWDYWVLYLQVFLISIVIPLKCWLIQFFWFKYLVKTIYLLRCFISLLHYSMQVLDSCWEWGK